MIVELMSHTKDPERTVAVAAKLCYAGCSIDELRSKQTEDGIKEFISMLGDLGHESPFEHANFTFGIEGVSRITEQQLTRHRIASYSIQSGRYVTRKNARFYKPSDIAKYKVVSDIYDEAIEKAKSDYEAMIFGLMHAYCEELCKSKGVFLGGESPYVFAKRSWPREYSALEKRAAENARAIYPNALETKIIFTMNARSLHNFLKHRCCNRAQEEIRELAMVIRRTLIKEFPLLFKGAGPSCISGICPENSMQCKQFKKIIPTMKDVRRMISLYWEPGRGIKDV